MAIATANSEAAIFARMIDADSTQLSPDGARAWLSMDFCSADRTRMHELALKAQAGELTFEEEEELSNFRDVGNLLAIMHSRARRVLSNSK